MEKKPQHLKKDQLKQQTESSKIVTGSFIATVIAISPYIFYLHESVPDVKIWSTFIFGYEFKYTSIDYSSVGVEMWILLGKIVPLYLILLWFLTCRHWWYHALLVPISMYSYQIFEVLNKDTDKLDTNQLIYLVPIMALTIPSIYLIRAKIFNKVNETNKSMQQLEDELKFKPRNLWGKITQYF